MAYSNKAPSLTESSRSVLRLVARLGSVTRPQLGEALNLSKPTMSAAIAELSELGLVASVGQHKGPMGRSAMVYGLGAGAGYVIGVDVGAAQVRAVAHTLSGDPLSSAEVPIPRRGNASVEAVGAIIDQVVHSTIAAVGERQTVLRSVAVAVPRIVATHPLGLNRRKGPEAVLTTLRSHIKAPIIIENNVNCAAIAEMHHGAARARGTFLYLQVGVRVGLGIVINNALYRGFNGAAGEAGRIPFPWSSTETPYREGLEHYLGSDALLSRCVQSWPSREGPPPTSAKDLFERAGAGSEHAMHWVRGHAADIGRLVAGCVGLLDPGLVILGGGVGQNPLLVGEVQRVARDLTWTTDVVTSSLGANATALGAMHLAVDHGLGLILGENRHPAVVLPSYSAESQPDSAGESDRSSP